MNATLRYILVSICYLAGYFGLTLASTDLWTERHVQPWFPQAGLGLTLLLVFGPRYFPVIVLATTIAANQVFPTKLGLAHALLLGGVTALGYAAGAEYLRTYSPIDLRLRNPRDIERCLLVALVLPLVIAAAGLGPYVASGSLAPSNYVTAIAEWWIGDALGILCALPALLTTVLPRLRVVGVIAPTDAGASDLQPRAAVEVLVQLASIAMSIWITFGWSSAGEAHGAHIMFLPLLWIVIRHGLRGAAWGVAVLSGGIIAATSIEPSPHYSVIELQLLMLGMAVSALLMGMVVSERERAKQKLAASQQTSAAILDAIPDLMFRMRHDGTYVDFHAPDGVVLLVPPEQFLGKTPEQVLPPALARKSIDAIARAVSTGKLAQFEYSNTGDEEVRHFEVRVVPSGNHEVLSLVRNITDRKRLENDLIKAQKMEAVGMLAAGIAHDFNNVLSAIFAYIGVARARLEPGDPALLTSLNDVDAAARQAAGVLRSLLTFAKKSTSEFRPTDLSECARVAADLIRPTLPSSISLVFRAPEVGDQFIPILVRGDETQLQQVVLNLAINARDAMPDGGILSITVSVDQGVEPVPPGATLAPRSARVEVTDTGVGIDPASLPRIFEPFFSTKSRDVASGLGLAIADGIIKAHSGTIAADTSPMKGTRFIVRVPIDPSAQFPTGTPDTFRNVDGSSVLVVASQRQVREFIAAGIARHGYAVAQACDPQSIRAAIARYPTFVSGIVDLDLEPEQAHARIMEIRRTLPDLPLIFLVSDLESPLPDVGRGLVISKPFQIAGLASAIRQQLDNYPSQLSEPST